MALRDQPYLPLYVQDFLTDEKLIQCTAATTGVYIRLMCFLHKSDQYGCILLRQKFKQTDKQIKNFALQLAKIFPYDFACIEDALTELIEESVMLIEGDLLIQKRMVKDACISEKRALAGKKGGEETNKSKPKNNKFAAAKTVAKQVANTENEDVNENIIDNVLIMKAQIENIKTPFQIAIDDFVEMRKKIKNPVTSKALAMIKTKANQLAKGDEISIIEIFNRSTINNWKDVYPLKETGSEAKGKGEIAINSHESFVNRLQP
jgi:hypothetical protein